MKILNFQSNYFPNIYYKKLLLSNMTMISIEKETLKELLDSKLKQIIEKINFILSKWNYNSIEKFLKDSRDGTIEEAEMDAISLINLRDNRNKWMDLKISWSND